MKIQPFIAGKASGDWTERVFNCFHNRSYWNGWAMPHFLFDEALKVADHLKMTYDKDADSFIVIDEAYPDEPTIYAPLFITVDGADLKVWDLGSGYYCWDMEEDVLP